MALCGKVFVATCGPAGPGRAVWSQVNDTTWQEKKDEQDEVLEYSYCGPSRTPGSNTVRLRLNNEEAQTEVIITADSIQIFVDGAYFGEYIGAWEREGMDSISEVGDSPPSVLSRKGSKAGSEFSKASQALKATAPPTPPPPLRPTRPVKAANCDKSPEMVEKLYAAVKAQDRDVVTSLLKQPVDPDCVCPSAKETPLMAAAAKGPSAIAEALLNAGADVNIGVGGNTPMLIAFQKGRQEVQRILFASAFQQLECTVGALNPQASMLASMLSHKPIPEEEMGEELHRHELREVTARLAHLQHPHHKPDPYAQESSIEILPDTATDSDKMREEVVRETMRALMHASKTTDINCRQEHHRPATAPAGAGR